MGNKLNEPIDGRLLADKLCLPFLGNNLKICTVNSLDNATKSSLCFTKKQSYLEGLAVNAVIIAPENTLVENFAVIESKNPRLTFARALNLLSIDPGFSAPNTPAIIHPSAKVKDTCVIGCGVNIGKRTIIEHNVVIADGVKIGDDCYIKSNSVIGEPGFGFERDENGIPIRLIHLGSVVIGNRVEIGSLNTVCKGTLSDTIIEDDVKTDDHVHIAHNCRIRRGALITACVELSGGVDVGEFAWLGPNSSVIQKAVLGDNSFIGIASNVTKSVACNTTVAGNPARILKSS